MRYSFGVAILILLSAVISGVSPAAVIDYSDAGLEEIIGDWIITENTTVVNRTIVLQGNLLIRGGGLELLNSTLIMRCYADGQFRIAVETGYLSMSYSKITAENPENRYYIVIEKGALMSSEHSYIEYSGYEDGERSGLYVLGKLDMSNTTLRWNYCPLWAQGLKNTTLRNITLHRNSWGMRFLRCENLSIVGANITENYRTGIWMEGGEGNVIKGAFIEKISLPSRDSIAQGIRIENESYALISNNTIKKTNQEGIFITGEESQRNRLLSNTLTINGVAGIHLYKSSNNTIEDNNITVSYMGVLLERSDFNILKNNLLSTSVGIKLRNSFRNHILFGELKDVKNYGIMLYSSNRTIVSGVKFDNVTRNLYLKDSMVVFAGHMYSDKYLISGTSKLYLASWVRVTALDYEGAPINWVRLKLRFLGEEIAKGVTYRDGTAGFLAPYLVHTVNGKRYSWCEIEAESDLSFEENPIRFYSWETRRLVFMEKAPGIDVSLSTDKKEAVPGDTINITLEICDSGKPVDNATVDMTVGGKPMFPPKRVGEGIYSMSLRVPDFENSLKIEVRASVGNKTGFSSTTVMKPSVEYGASGSVEDGSDRGASYMVYVLALLLFSVLMFFSARKRVEGRSYETMRPISPERFEIEK